jgi:transcription elongation factor GreA
MTPQGFEKIRDELKRLVETERPSCVLAIETARAHGDISENSEYEDAKHNQAIVEGRILELEDKLSHAQVIDPRTLRGDKVMFGATVTMEDADSGETVRYQIVGTDESDLRHGRISIESPIGKALLGKRVDDEISFEVPRGTRTVTITEVQYI